MEKSNLGCLYRDRPMKRWLGFGLHSTLTAAIKYHLHHTTHQTYKAGWLAETGKLGFMHDIIMEKVGYQEIGGQQWRHVRECAPSSFQCDVSLQNRQVICDITPEYIDIWQQGGRAQPVEILGTRT
ncbi:hypothetical protein SS1G_00778 [Sclerotinia sclerotiorum 1980 UF-70]|uniref:Uncharacterized protein n=1 Tax=Sclerotinia sclerotiorum (strain ATCC 18683 / 1980 / Ss-1) TaxID=665079 RepID=A7E653_SCLS1|nr:hypothetical protein SS1G_00778 [Sclerotinia sclerotiorum 1980 UF-70]EDN91375.1 hypothetical protein SS1G_00778 [Sclerotinia sclerotiorum 1980 UF-70]